MSKCTIEMCNLILRHSNLGWECPDDEFLTSNIQHDTVLALGNDVEVWMLVDHGNNGTERLLTCTICAV